MRRRSVEVEKEDISEVKRETKKEKIRTGTVNCAFLNVRKEPKPNAKLLKIIRKDDTVVIDANFEDNLWYKIEDGYVKKAFIDIFMI